MLRFANADCIPTRLPPVYGYHAHSLVPLRQALDPVIPRISGLEKFIQIAKTECHYPSEDGLAREESASIYIYTMDWGETSLYRLLNADLRKSDRAILAPWHAYLKLFETALEKLPNVTKSVWRGVNMDLRGDFQQNQTVTWWALTSCSISVKEVEGFLGSSSTLLMIETKKAKDISTYSNYPKEKEVILNLGTRVRRVGDVLGKATLNVVHLEEISDEDVELEISTSLNKAKIDQNQGTSPRISLLPLAPLLTFVL